MTAKDLGPAYELAKYQARIRNVFKPNTGENLGGKVADKILSYLQSFNGQFVGKREMERSLNLNRYDPRVAESVYASLKATGQIIEAKVGKKIVVRLAPDEEPDLI